MSSASSTVGTDDEGYNSRRTTAEEASEDDAGTASFSAASSDISSVARSSQMDAVSIQSEPGSGFCLLDWRSEMTPGSVSTD